MKSWGFLGGSDTVSSATVNSELTENLYPEFSTSPAARSRLSLFGTPGLRNAYTGLTGPIRGSFEQDGRCMVVGGGSVYELLADETTATRGEMGADPLPVTFASNGTYLVMTSAGRVYVLTLATNAFAVVADADCPTNALMVKYLAGYFIVLTTAGQIIYSALNDPTTWDATDLIIKLNTSDKVLAIEVHNQQLWLFGSNNIEVFANTGDALLPFQPLPGVVIEQGLAASFSVAKIANSLMFLGEHSSGNAVVYRTQGYAAVRVSTHGEEFALSQEGTPANSVAWFYQELGHDFYLLNLTGSTRVYDTTTGLWHSRVFRNPGNGQDEAHLGQCHAYAFGKHLVGSRRDGVVYEMRLDLHTDAGDPIRRRRRSAYVSSEDRMLRHSRLTLDMEVGVGDSDDRDPVAMLRHSNNGKTWSNERMVRLGAVGEHDTRVIFRRLGRARRRVYDLVISAGVKVALIDGYLDVAV